MLEQFDCKVPEGLEKNKMIVYITASSPLSAYKAYLKQFQRDFTTFLKLRSEEMVSNGRMVLTFIGRNNMDNPLHRDCCHFWTLLSKSLHDLVIEVYIKTKTFVFFLSFHILNIYVQTLVSHICIFFIGSCECFKGRFVLHAFL